MSPSEFDQRAEARVGTTLRGKYRLDSVLGIGGMAVVYAATHRNQKRFAVKMLHRELSLEADICARFLREGYAANTVNHPGAVAVLDDDVAEDGAAFLVMELLEGESVEGVAARMGQRLPLSAALAIAYQVLDVLDASHKNEIVHRDIKPANLFLVRDGRLKVLDFGIARVRDATPSHLATRTGTTLGTPAFMAPEQALGETDDIGPQTDLWAVGATLFTLISGALVHEGQNASQLLVRAATMPARSLSTVAPETPAPVVQLVGTALAFDKRERWASALAMREAIDEVHRELFGGPPTFEQLKSLFDTDLAVPSRARASQGPATMTAVDGNPPASARLPTPVPRVSSTTAKPVSAGQRVSHRPERGRWGWVGAAGLLAAAATAAVHYGAPAPPALPASRTVEKPAPSDAPAQPPVDAPVTLAIQNVAAPSVFEPAPISSVSKTPATPSKSGFGHAHASPLPLPAPSASAAGDRNPLRMPLQ